MIFQIGAAVSNQSTVIEGRHILTDKEQELRKQVWQVSPISLFFDLLLWWIPLHLVDTWLTEFRIDRILDWSNFGLTQFRIDPILDWPNFGLTELAWFYKRGTFCMFKQVCSDWLKAIWSIRNSVNTGPMLHFINIKNFSWYSVLNLKEHFQSNFAQCWLTIHSNHSPRPKHKRHWNKKTTWPVAPFSSSFGWLTSAHLY